MTRRPRLALDGVAVHLVQRGVDRGACFFADEDRAFYLDLLAELAPRFGCAVHAFVLMTNHVHLLLTPARADGPSLLMQKLGQRYVRAVNRAAGRTGTLWEGRFRSCLVDDDGYLLACQRYIELNPVRARIVAHPRDWVWSSYRAHAEARPSALLTPHPLWLALGRDDETRRAAWRALVAERLPPATVDAIRGATNGNYALGDDRFRAQIEAMLGRRAARGRPGRKPKVAAGMPG